MLEEAPRGSMAQEELRTVRRKSAVRDSCEKLEGWGKRDDKMEKDSGQ